METIKSHRIANGHTPESIENDLGSLTNIDASLDTIIEQDDTHVSYSVPGGVYVVNNSACDMFIAESGEEYFLE